MKKVTNSHLLNDDLRKKVEKKMKACYALAEKEYKVKFEFPEIRYDIKSWMGGLAYYKTNLVRFNLILLVENEEDYIKNTVPHEIAHLIAYKLWLLDKDPKKKRLMPHGALWKKVMGVLGVVPNVKHTYDCTSIERHTKRKARSTLTRVQRVLKQVMRFTPEERLLLVRSLDDGF